MKRFATFLTATSLTLATVTVAPAALAQNDPTYRAILGVGPDDTSVSFSWRSDYKGDEVVRLWKQGTKDSTDIAGREFDGGAIAYTSRRAEASGLEPGARYNYQIGSNDGGWSAINTFTTADGDRNQGVLVYSDVQIGTNLKYDEQGRNWRDAATRGAAQYPDAGFHIYLGDQVEGWGDQMREYNEFFSPNQIRQTPGAAIMGNHEEFVSGTKHYNEHYVNPNAEWADKDFYFERENTLFLNLNSNRRSEKDVDEHIEFLNKTVKEHGEGKDWIVLSFHHTMFTPTKNSVWDPGLPEMRARLAPVLSELGVNLVLNGHDHIYSRTHLMENGVPVVPEKRAEVGDVLEQKPGQVMYIALNTATNSKYTDFRGTDGEERPNYTRDQTTAEGIEEDWQALWQQDYNPDFTYLDITPEHLTIRTHNVYSQELVDEVTLLKPGAKAPAPYEPTDVAVPTSPVIAPTVTATVTETTTKAVPTTVATTVPTTITATEKVTEKATETVTDKVPATVTETVPATITPTVTVTATKTVTEPATTVTATSVATTTVKNGAVATTTVSGAAAQGSSDGRCIATLAGFGVPLIALAAAATVGLPLLQENFGPQVEQALDAAPQVREALDQAQVDHVAAAAGVPAVALLLIGAVASVAACSETADSSK